MKSEKQIIKRAIEARYERDTDKEMIIGGIHLGEMIYIENEKE